MSWIDDLNNSADVGQTYRFQPLPKQNTQKKKKGNLLTSLIPTGGSIAGGAAGAAIGSALLPGIGTLIGAGLGSALGGGAGKVAENAAEGNKLSSGVAGEAALSGVLGAGPLRLGKAAVDTVRGVKAGAGIADALKAGGQAGAEMSILRGAGNKLTNASNDLAVKNYRFTPSQLNNFKSKFGEDASQVLKRYKLGGGDATAIQERAIQPLQSEFDNIAANIPDVPKATLQKAFEAKYKPLLNSGVEDNRAMGQQLKSQSNTILKKYGDTIPGSDLGGLRKEFDGLLDYTDKAANPARYGVNKRSADTIRSVLQAEADRVGLRSADGKSFKEVGLELSKLRQLAENASKQEQLGRGSLPASLTGLLGGGLGTSAFGGPLGAAGGFAATKAVNSNTGRRALEAGTEKLGQRLTEKAAQTNPYGLGQTTKRVAPVGIAQSLTQSSENNDMSMIAPTSMNAPINANMIDTSYQNSQQMSSNNPFDVSNVTANIEKLVSAGASDKQIESYLSIASAIQSMQAAQAKASGGSLNATQLQQANNAQSGLDSLGTIAGILQQDPNAAKKAALPGGSFTQALTGTGQYQAAINNATDVIGRLRSGGAINADEEKRFRSLLPAAFDSPDTVQYKLGSLAQLFQKFTNPQAAQPGASDLASALGL